MCSGNDGGRMARSGTDHHVWRVDVTEGGRHITFRAVGEGSVILDTVERTSDQKGEGVTWSSANHPDARHPDERS